MASKPIARYDLPATVCRDIGRIITRWAYVEHYLQNIVYMLIGVSQAIGRLAVREPRATDRLDLIRDLIAAKGLTEPDVDYKALRLAMEDIEDLRNVTAHSIWHWSSQHQAWVVQIARGSWEGVNKTDRAKKSKRIAPEGQIIKSTTFAGYILGIDGIIQILKKMQANLEEQLAASDKKPPSPSHFQ